MSTSVIHPGTTRSAGPSGRFVGLAAAALAAVIALGFVFSANQGNEATESVTELRLSQTDKAAWDSRVEFETQREYMRRASQPSVNIERYRMEMAGVIGAITPSTSPEAYKALQQQAAKAQVNPRILVTVPAPVLSPELARLQAVNTAPLQATWSQHYQDVIDSFESLTVPNGHEAFNPSILVTIPEPLFSPELARLQAVNTAPLQATWSQHYQDVIDSFAGQEAHANWPKGFQDLMDSYEGQIAAAKVADEGPRVPR